MNERECFEKALKENPHDTVTRGIFSDWLEEQGRDEEAAEQRRMATTEWVNADKWMLEFAENSGGADDNYPNDPSEYRRTTYEEIIQAGHGWLNSREYLCQFGEETLRNKMYDVSDEWWKNWEIITGRKVTEDERDDLDRFAPFACSC